MDGLKELHPQQATEWYYPNLMHRFVWCGTGKKKNVPPFYFALSLSMARHAIIGTMYLYK